MARLNAPAPEWDRFAHWPRGAALAALAGFALLLLAAALTWQQPLTGGHGHDRVTGDPAAATAPAAERDTDLQLYDRIAERVGAGDDYYAAAIEEQRARDFPVRPGLAVRLPTLAFIAAWLGPGGLLLAACLLGLAVLAAWWARLGAEPGGSERRVIALLLLAIGCAMGLKPQYLALHEVWAGMLLALSFGLHRPGRWRGAWFAAAAALAIREHALPFVLLLAALAGWRRDWREAGAWAALAALFALGLLLHLGQVSVHLLPGDRPSPSWLVLRGLYGWTSSIAASSVLHLLPGPLAAPLALLPLIGWAGWRSTAGVTGTLLHAGYGLGFMLAGRDNNFYWALVVVPTWFIGLAFMPRALASLWQSARRKAPVGKT